MPLRSIGFAALAALMFAAAQQAHAAADETSLLRERSTTVYAQLGLGTPLGYGGAEIEQTLTSLLVLSAGAGMGAVGPQLAFMPRLKIAGSTSALLVGAGVSYGKFRDDSICGPFCDGSDVREGKVLWLNLEAAVEHRWTNGLTLRGFLGAGHGLTDSMVCVSPGGCGRAERRPVALPYLGVALGWSF